MPYRRAEAPAATAMTGRTVLVTGGTSGIGFCLAAGLAARGGRVLITGPDPVRGKRAALELGSARGAGEVLFLQAEHSTVAGNHDLARRVADQCGRLDVLVNNVGGGGQEIRRETAEALEETLALNAVGPVALTQALLPLLRDAAPSRIVNVVSSAHCLWRSDPFSDIQSLSRYVGIEAYARAKLLNVLWTLSLAARLRRAQVVVNAVNPGMAARSPLEVASSAELSTVTGTYFESDARAARPSASAMDERQQARAHELLCDLSVGALQ